MGDAVADALLRVLDAAARAAGDDAPLADALAAFDAQSAALKARGLDGAVYRALLGASLLRGTWSERYAEATVRGADKLGTRARATPPDASPPTHPRPPRSAARGPLFRRRARAPP
jgi:hypothetical protein